MAAPVIKQIQGTFQGILFIIVGSILMAISYGYMSNELKVWHDLWGVIDHAAFVGVGISAGWIVLKSPFAPQFQTVLGSTKETTTQPSGAVTTKESSVEIKTPVAPPPAKS